MASSMRVSGLETTSCRRLTMPWSRFWASRTYRQQASVEVLEKMGDTFRRQQRQEALAVGVVEALVEIGLIRRVRRREDLNRGFDIVAAEELLDALCEHRALLFSRHS